MTYETIMAGFGGQGLLFSGKVLAHAALIEGKGFSLVEVVSTCPTNWGLTPDKACAFVEEKMIPFYPLGCYKDKE